MDTPTSSPKNHKLLWIIMLSIFGAALVSVAYAEQASIYNGLNALQLIPTPERFTELYFNDPTLLPRTTTARKPITFAFTVHNLEGVTMTYPYSVYFIDATGRETVFSSGEITLADNASTSIIESHAFPASNEKGKVVINLTALNQEIDFLLPDTNP